MELGLFAVIAAVVAGGVVGALARMWGTSSRLYSLEDRVSILEGIQSREVKARASAKRWDRMTAEEAAALTAIQQPAPAQPQIPFWKRASNLPRSAPR